MLGTQRSLEDLTLEDISHNQTLQLKHAELAGSVGINLDYSLAGSKIERCIWYLSN